MNAVKTFNISYFPTVYVCSVNVPTYEFCIFERMYSLGENSIIRVRALLKLMDRMVSDDPILKWRYLG